MYSAFHPDSVNTIELNNYCAHVFPVIFSSFSTIFESNNPKQIYRRKKQFELLETISLTLSLKGVGKAEHILCSRIK